MTSGSLLSDRARLAALTRLQIIDPEAEETFDRLTRRAARLVDAPMAFMSFLDGERQFRGAGADGARDTVALEHSFRQHVERIGGPLRVHDVRADPRMERVAEKLANAGLIACCGVPLIDSSGHTLGSLCAIDHAPHIWSDEDIEILRELATSAMTEIELRLAYRDLAAREQEVRSIVEGAHEAFVSCTAAGTITEWNPAATRLLGWSESEAVGRSLLDTLAPPERRALISERLRTGYYAKSVARMEIRLLHRDGRVLELEASVTTIEEAGGRRYNMLARDVGELRSLRRHQAHLAHIVETAEEAIATVDGDGRVTAWNAAAERMYGYSAAEVIGQPLPELDPASPALSTGADPLPAALLRGEAINLHDAPRRHRDGTVFYVDVSLSPIRDAHDGIVGMAAIARDVTDRRRLELELRASEARFRATFDDAPSGIFLLGIDRVLLDANRAFFETLGRSRSELVGRTLEWITQPEDVVRGGEGARALLAGEAATYRAHPRYRHKDGHDVWVQTSGSLVRDADGNPEYFIVHMEDVTAARAAAAATAEAHALLDDSQSAAHVGSWSHDLATGELAWSREQYRLHGLDPEAGPTSLDGLVASIHPDDRGAARAALASLIRDPRTFEGEYRVVHASGAVRTLAVNAQPADDPSFAGRIYGITRDVTAEHEARRAQSEVEQRHRRLLASLPDTMVVLYDHELRSQVIQGGLVATLDIEVDTFLGVALEGSVPHADQLRPPITRALAGETVAIELLVRGRLVQIELGPYQSDTGETVGAFSVWRDVTAQRRREDENRVLATMLQQCDDAIIAVDLDGVITAWNTGAERLYGYSSEQALGRSASLIIPPERAAEGRTSIAAIRRGEAVQCETVRRRKGGRRVDVSISVSPLKDADGAIVGASAIARNISERIAAETARREIEERLRVTVEHAPIGVALVELDGDAPGALLNANEAFARLVGDPGLVTGGATLVSLMHPEDGAALGDDLVLLATDGLARTETEVRCARSDGSVVWLLLTGAAVPATEGGPRLAVVHALDIGERKRFEGQLQHLADHDPLTGLYNRRRFEQELARAVSMVRRHGPPSALLMIDLDGFKHVNDTMGHTYGDELITRVGATLRTTLRETDVIARLGGDEFAVVLAGVTPLEAEGVAEKLLCAIQQRAVAPSAARHPAVTASVGIAHFDQDTVTDAEELLVEADVAMYRAKGAGKNQLALSVADAGGRRALSQRQSWERRLLAAFEEDRFELFAQPIHGICANGVERYELLLRLRGDEGELIKPGTFLYNAERFDLVQRIDRWVFERALELLSAQHAAGRDISVSVNMSGKTLGDPAIVADLTTMVRRCPVPADRLVVEVTETAAIVNLDRAREVAAALRELGCRFALDDFGSGFASFCYLKHLDFAYVKIDGEFVKSLSVNATDQLVVRSVVDLARGLGAQTIAEFVGDDESLERLRELGVDYGQGYHLGRPAPVDEVLPIAPGSRAAP